MTFNEREFSREQQELFNGRQLLLNQLPTEVSERLWANRQQLTYFQLLPAIQERHGDQVCQRCGSLVPATNRLPTGHEYCRQCLALGRVTSADYLVRLQQDYQYPHQSDCLTWSGQLTTAQQQVSDHILQQFRQQKRPEQLLWAVTGAGKTEMTFPVIAAFLAQGQRVGFVSPRVDVCNELFPRVKAAFAHCSVGLFHGQVHEQYQNEQLIIATTHQLLRFYQAFDLLIVDEVDAFPYAGDPMLQRAVATAVKPQGNRLYLSATPPSQLLSAAKRKQLPLHYLARRFHGRQLPVPEVKFGKIMVGQEFSSTLQNLLRDWVQRQRRFLIFLPEIVDLAPIAQKFKQLFPQVSMATVYAADEQRATKVQNFRDEKLAVLLTTTILERGVTFANIDVLILAADHRNYSTASLVQIAGRVGRAAEFANGTVVFYSEYYTLKMRRAVRMIRHLNTQGGF
ncbi:DEAD/DEAH box helicase [Lapidilactobacillus bayanensis]|uniref:DEAD/DEAH box helicase n=1 Tax=Lapidilactobacillus bayanensis TaxID=2485998 RepID=UPI0013DDC1A3|nr:DEAD/DEAH box helicase family protein [Lapidilactobacillus bayanensis]